jgi:hypothetical protein
MQETFADKVWLTLIDKLAIGALLLGAGFFLNRLLERFRNEQALQKEYELRRDQAALTHLRRQIEELYSPLLGLIEQSRLIYDVACQKLPRLREGSRALSSKEEVDVWRYFLETYFLPLNRQMAELIRTKIDLIDSDDIPGSFQQFLEHQVQLDCLHRLWRDRGISSDEVSGKGWPKEFERSVGESLAKLRQEYNEYVRRLKRTG